MGQTTGVGDGGTHVVDELFLDQGDVIAPRVDNLADGDRRGGVLTHDAQEFLILLGWSGVFHPEQVVRLERFAEASCLNRAQTVVGIVQQDEVLAVLVTNFLEHSRKRVEVGACVPNLFDRHRGTAGRLVVVTQALLAGALLGVSGTGDTVGGRNARQSELNTGGLEAHVAVHVDGIEQAREVHTGSVGVGQNAGAGSAAQQLVNRDAGLLGLDVPQCHIHSGDGGHGHRSTLPVSTLVQVLPDVLDVVLILADKARSDGL